jgi:hypothetical protein
MKQLLYITGLHGSAKEVGLGDFVVTALAARHSGKQPLSFFER